ncbi:HTH domain-containing protein [Leptolyngbya sp. KIOST-1]|uniref:HTH domain-containing protein n=1 Tax=Leptolyngbya sp. KIOST-1 TaxID=1229172 RepID=UPI0005668A89|nr:HTH domain-containing protein [Leptolyngbya sp. KIOST-1]
MKERTIAEAAVEVLKAAKEPMTAAEITQVILDKGLYEFNTQDQVGMVRRAIARRCEGYERKDSMPDKIFEKRPSSKYTVKN